MIKVRLAIQCIIIIKQMRYRINLLNHLKHQKISKIKPIKMINNKINKIYNNKLIIKKKNHLHQL
jgi:hypothetical protein